MHRDELVDAALEILGEVAVGRVGHEEDGAALGVVARGVARLSGSPAGRDRDDHGVAVGRGEQIAARELGDGVDTLSAQARSGHAGRVVGRPHADKDEARRHRQHAPGVLLLEVVGESREHLRLALEIGEVLVRVHGYIRSCGRLHPEAGKRAGRAASGT